MKDDKLEQIVANLELPFRTRASFSSIIDYWEKMAAEPESERRDHARNILQKLDDYPELKAPIDSIDVLLRLEEPLGMLLAPLFPEPLQGNEIKAVTMPFSTHLLNPTRRFKNILDRAGDSYAWEVNGLGAAQMYVMSCVGILNAFYHAGIEYKFSNYFDIPNIETGVIRRYRAFFNADFTQYSPTERTVPLTDADIRELVENVHDIDLWKAKIPPFSYDLVGFGIVSLFDVTEEEALSSIKNSLLQKHALQSSVVRDEISKYMQAYLNIGSVQVGFAMFDEHTRKIHMMMTESDWSCMTLTDDGVLDSTRCFCDVSYEEIFDRQSLFVVSDTSRFPKGESQLIDRMDEWGVKSFTVAPLAYDGKVLGFLEVGSEEPGVINTVNAQKLQSVLPMFTVAMQRAIEERESQLDAIVQEKFTTLHSSVSWKFKQVAERTLDSRLQGVTENSDEVIFRDVIPLFGQFDIRGSSAARNASIQKDLVKQLTLAEQVMDAARKSQKLPIYDHLRFRIQKYRTDLEAGIMAGDEVKILDFLKTEIYPVFNHLSEKDIVLKESVTHYMQSLDDELQVVYEERKRYDSSITQINEFISGIIEAEQVKAQGMFPHYFEKYKTDGVEYNMYIGQSLQPGRPYDKVYLQNLRLWQLLLTAHIESKVDELQASLPMPLRITSMILAHNSPLSIKFRQDEKKFDVDGAYNIRYEIMKKRIDKAHIKNSTERLTQPGKIAIVYSQDEEAAEYLQYLEYLKDLEIIGGQIEQLELEELQETSGLKALRAELIYSGKTQGHLSGIYEGMRVQ